jgi:hypothetical protein
MSNIPPPMPLEELLGLETSNSLVNTKKQSIQPGANPWSKYAILGGLVAISLIGAYYITKPKKQINYGKENK